MMDNETLRAVAAVQKRYKITRRSNVYRFAVAVLAPSPMLAIQSPAPKPRGRRSPRPKRLRFGYEWFEKFCRDHGTTLTVMNAETLSPEEEMTQDPLSIIRCFSSRPYGLRKYKKQIAQLAREKPAA